jgi:hypothetical protein
VVLLIQCLYRFLLKKGKFASSNVENLRFSSFFISFLFYRRFLTRRTLVRLSLVSRRFPLKPRSSGLPPLGITENKK